jgi:curved DNA-binding protein CbpA
MSEAFPDWYAVLGVERSASADEIASAVEKLARTAAALAVTNPERSQQTRDHVRAIRRQLLSAPEVRRSYDQLLQQASQSEGPPARAALQPTIAAPAPGAGMASRFIRFLKQGWTCQSCGTQGAPGDRFCASCGAEIKAIPDAPRGDQNAVCPSCRARVRVDDRFCPGCGASQPEN